MIKVGDHVRDFSSLNWGIREGTVIAIEGRKAFIQEGASTWMSPINFLETIN